MFTDLLKRQLKRYLKDDAPSANLNHLLEAINRSYEHYERDHILSNRSLEISSEELRELALELSDHEKKLWAILEAAHDGILVVNNNLEIEICNAAVIRYLGLGNYEDIIGRNISTIDRVLIKKIGSQELMTLSQMVSLHQSGLLECSICYDNNTSLPIELSISQVQQTAQLLNIYLIRDISSRKEAEKKMALRHIISRQLLENTSLEEVSPKIISTLCNELDWSIGFFALTTQENILKPCCFYQSNELPSSNKFKDKTYELFLNNTQAAGNTFLETKKKPHFIQNISEQQVFLRRKEAEDCGLHSYICLPIIGNKEFLGIIELFNQKICSYDDELMKMLLDIGTEIGGFIIRENALKRELELQKQFVVAAREAGMMEVATSVLHNVGNALNTVNIAVSTIQENIWNSEINNLPKLAELINVHRADLPNFFNKDPQGKYVLEYLVALADFWKKEREKNDGEMNIILNNIHYIKNIIDMQQSASSFAGLKEKIDLNKILTDLIFLHSKQFKRYNIHVQTVFDDLPNIVTDRSRLLQILENIIRNAVEALEESKTSRKIILRTTKKDPDSVQIEIADNGCGIEKENLLKIFSYGFTSKKKGHGFGLHSSALLAKELNGQLRAISDGPGKGAIFVLSLPINS